MRAGEEEYQLVFLSGVESPDPPAPEPTTPDPNNPAYTLNKAAVVSAVHYGSITCLHDTDVTVLDEHRERMKPRRIENGIVFEV